MSMPLDLTLRNLNDKQGCEGITVLTPSRIYNKPGLKAIAYRSGTHGHFKQTMLARLSGSGDRAALNRLSTRDDKDFTIALLDAWSAVADVLTFYQERIANESCLLTATERLSLLNMVRLIGYKLKPGVAADTYLAFTVDDAPESPRVVTIPLGTRAQSIPEAGDQLPQPFETSVVIEARPEWNELRPRMTKEQVVSVDSEKLYLQGTSANLRIGDVLLFTQENDQGEIVNNEWDIRRITSVKPDNIMSRTLVTWTNPKPPGQTVPSTKSKVYVLGQRANIFGHNAPDWRSLPDEAKATYLGLEDPKELTAFEKTEWPSFVIAAPLYPHELIEEPELTRKVLPTVESVAAAISQVTDSLTNAAITDAIKSFTEAVNESLDVVVCSISTAAHIVNQLIPEPIDGSPDTSDTDLRTPIVSIIKSSVDFVKDVLPTGTVTAPTLDDTDKSTLFNMYQYFQPLKAILDWIGAALGGSSEEQVKEGIQLQLEKIAEITEKIRIERPNISLDGDLNFVDNDHLNNIRDNLETLMRRINPASSFLSALHQIDLTHPTCNLTESIAEAITAINNVPTTLAKTAGADIVAKVVSNAVKAALEIPIPEVLRTPELVGFVAVASAKIAVVALAIHPDDILQELFLGRVRRLDENGQPLSDAAGNPIYDEIERDDVLLAGLAAGVIVTGVTGVTYSVAVLFSLIGPVIFPLLLPFLLLAVALGDELYDGAKEAEQRIREAVAKALMPKFDPLPKRRPLLQLTDNMIDLDYTYSKITPGGWLLLSLPNNENLYKINKVNEASRNDFTLNAKTTRITLNGADFRQSRFVISEGSSESIFNILLDSEHLFFRITEGSLIDLVGDNSIDDSVINKLKEIKDIQFRGKNDFETKINVLFPPPNEIDVTTKMKIFLHASELYNDLKRIEDKDFVGRTRFLDVLKTTIGAEAADEFGEAIADIAKMADPTQEDPFLREVRMLTVFAQSEELTPSEQPDTNSIVLNPNESNIIILDRRVDGLKQGHLIIISGEKVGSGELVSKVVTLSTEPVEEEYTKLTFTFTGKSKLKMKRDTVTIYANVSPATHGETREEVLGSGDASKAFQSFRLKQTNKDTPLTHISSSEKEGAESTLKVRVNDIKWDEVISRHELDATQKAYVTLTDDEGRTTITFGDGYQGARPATGLENITAKYRVGIGLKGNMPANQISLLATRPLGVRRVFNPVPASGGEEPERLEEVRRNAPLTVLTLDRIVSLQDYEDFARNFPGISKAYAVLMQEEVHITVAGPEGAVVSEKRREELKDAMHEKGDPFIPIEVYSYNPKPFQIEAKIKVHEDYLSDKVITAVEEELKSYFSFELRQFGQPVTLSEIYTVIQNIPGVVAVQVAKPISNITVDPSELLMLDLDKSIIEPQETSNEI